jgi:hypothetical protein
LGIEILAVEWFYNTLNTTATSLLKSERVTDGTANKKQQTATHVVSHAQEYSSAKDAYTTLGAVSYE